MTRKERAEEIDAITDDIYLAFLNLCDSMHRLEGLGCKKECKKLDTVTGKLENLCNDLSDKTSGVKKWQRKH